jgi:hypothetical protein
VLHTPEAAGETVGLTAEGGFLLKHQSFMSAINATGSNLRWAMQPRLSAVWGIVPDGGDGWLAAGPALADSKTVRLTHIDGGGNETWNVPIPGNAFVNVQKVLSLRAPDGTLRFLSSGFQGITVSAFRVAE